MTTMPSDPYGSDRVAVVHLALGSFGLEPFEAFVASYRAHAAGCPHVLIVALKQVVDVAPYDALLAGIDHRLILVPDEGYDLGTYWRVARETDFDFYCFLNSRSVILADDWLAKLMTALRSAPDVAAVGATGSLESIASNALHLVGVVHRWPRPLRRLRGLLGFLKLVRLFPPFPNPHLRTNAFLISRRRILRIRPPEISSKADAWHFESGWRGMTRRLTRRGAKVLVVNAEGTAYPVEQWSDSGTFWQGKQPHLLVADRQTRAYDMASPATQSAMQRNAWSPPDGRVSA
jgi:hypothetical protein